MFRFDPMGAMLQFENLLCIAWHFSVTNHGLHHCGSAIPVFFYVFPVTDQYDTK